MLRYSYVVKCEEVIKDSEGNIKEIYVKYDPKSRGGKGKKVKGMIHWVSAKTAVDVKVNLYDKLFTEADP